MTTDSILGVLINREERQIYGEPISRGQDRIAAAEREGEDVGSVGCINTIGRRLSPVGAPLGGYPHQRRNRRQRAMQRTRRLRRQYNSPEPFHCEACTYTTVARWEPGGVLCPVCGELLYAEMPF